MQTFETLSFFLSTLMGFEVTLERVYTDGFQCLMIDVQGDSGVTFTHSVYTLKTELRQEYKGVPQLLALIDRTFDAIAMRSFSRSVGYRTTDNRKPQGNPYKGDDRKGSETIELATIKVELDRDSRTYNDHTGAVAVTEIKDSWGNDYHERTLTVYVHDRGLLACIKDHTVPVSMGDSFRAFLGEVRSYANEHDCDEITYIDGTYGSISFISREKCDRYNPPTAPFGIASGDH